MPEDEQSKCLSTVQVMHHLIHILLLTMGTNTETHDDAAKPLQAFALLEGLHNLIFDPCHT